MRLPLLLLLLPALLTAQSPSSWSATDALGRELPGQDVTGPPAADKTVGIFYFAWLGAHGIDAHSEPLADEGVFPKDPEKDYQSPYDISKILEADTEVPQYGPELAFHHWGESVFGYYLSDDEWVIVKHAQLLGDAGVDVIVFDITNAVVYLPQALKVCTVFSRLQKMGWQVPKIAFLTNTRHVETTQRLYDGLYNKQLYPELWFHWKGKPLLMGNPEGLSDEITDFFNFRRSWAWTEGKEWFGDGKDKWPWIDHYPQNYGWHDSPDVPEQIVVSSAQHPISNIGRSFHNGRQPAPDSIESGVGHFFAEQWRRALEVDPEFVFVTGWNEWIAMRFNDGKARQIMGKEIKVGETYFVDQYNAEFSRDIEPMRGGFGDNYYYQMVDGIRRYKGTAAPPVQHAKIPITIDGKFADWAAATAVYYDHRGDTRHRNHPGWGRIDAYVNNSGRYDLAEARIADDGDTLAFYLLATTPFADNELPEDLELLLKTETDAPACLGYQYRLLKGADAGAVQLQKAKSDGKWSTLAQFPVAVAGGELELKLPKSLLGSPVGTLEFKWADKVGATAAGDALRFYEYGDTAPNARFNYSFALKNP